MRKRQDLIEFKKIVALNSKFVKPEKRCPIGGKGAADSVRGIGWGRLSIRLLFFDACPVAENCMFRPGAGRGQTELPVLSKKKCKLN
jgi:hypothetical protein